MNPEQRNLSGISYLSAATTLLQRVRSAHPTVGVWEAADLQWWWRKPRPTDAWQHPFWFDASGEPVAASVATDWGGRIGLDIVVMPTSPSSLVEQVWQRGLALVNDTQPSSVEVMINDEDSAMTSLLEEAGFSPLADKGVSAWMSAENHPTVSPTPAGYTLSSRIERGNTPHHFIARNGPGVANRLAQTSLYRPDLDLAMLDAAGEVAAYGLFWFDPTTRTGFVEPMGTNEGHRRKGLARHILTSGIDRLVQAGATRIKINSEKDNDASSNLYLDVGFDPVMTTSLWVSNEAIGP